MATKSKSPKSSSASSSVPVKCNFYIADDVRVEQGGKPSLLGFYADNVILIQMPKKREDPTKEHPIGIAGLAILANFIGAKGTYDVEMELFGPDGLSILKSGEGKLSNDAENLNFVPRFQPMPVVGFGQYKVVIKLNKKPFTCTFDVRRSQVAGPAPNQMVFPALTEEKAKARKKR